MSDLGRDSGVNGVASEDSGSVLDAVREVWSASSRDTTARRFSHWRGIGRFANDEAWLEIGRRTRVYVEQLLVEVGTGVPADPELTVLEWGPGGGSNVVALAPMSRRYYGVDVSSANLEECERQAVQVGLSGFVPLHFNGVPGEAVRQVQRPVDVIVCTSVFQHFPSADYGNEVLRAMRSCSHNGTVGVIQVRYEHRPDREPPSGDYRRDYIHHLVHPIPDFWWALHDAGFEPVRVVDLEATTRYAWFLFRTKGFAGAPEGSE